MPEIDRRTFLKLGTASIGVVVFGAQLAEGTEAQPTEATTREPAEGKRDPYQELTGLLIERTKNPRHGIKFTHNGLGFELRHDTYEDDRGSVRLLVTTARPDSADGFAGGFTINQDNLIPIGYVRHGEVFPGIDMRELQQYPTTPEQVEKSFHHAVALADFVQANLSQE